MHPLKTTITFSWGHVMTFHEAELEITYVYDAVGFKVLNIVESYTSPRVPCSLWSDVEDEVDEYVAELVDEHRAEDAEDPLGDLMASIQRGIVAAETRGIGA